MWTEGNRGGGGGSNIAMVPQKSFTRKMPSEAFSASELEVTDHTILRLRS